jgi:hypothetical protein
MDASGNVYVVGYVSNAVELGGSPLPRAGGFLASYSASGAHRWSLNTASMYGAQAIAVGASDAVAIAEGIGEIRIATWSRSGAAGWARAYPATAPTSASAIAADAAGNLFTTGSFSGSISPGASAIASVGRSDGILMSHSPSGTFRWAVRVGGSEVDSLGGVSVDPSGNVYVIGEFNGSVDLGGGAVTSVGYSDAFISCYSGAGAFRWTRVLGSASTDRFSAIANDLAGNVYATGQTAFAIDLAGTTIQPGAYVLSLTPSGSLRWSRSLAGPPSGFPLRGLQCDSPGNVYIGGGFYSSIPVDLGAGPLATRGGPYTIVVASYTPSGGYRWGLTFGGPGATDMVQGIVVDAQDSLYMTGYFQRALDLGNGALTSADALRNGDVFDVFVARLRP